MSACFSDVFDCTMLEAPGRWDGHRVVAQPGVGAFAAGKVSIACAQERHWPIGLCRQAVQDESADRKRNLTEAPANLQCEPVAQRLSDASLSLW